MCIHVMYETKQLQKCKQTSFEMDTTFRLSPLSLEQAEQCNAPL